MRHFRDERKTYQTNFYEHPIAIPWYILGVSSTYIEKSIYRAQMPCLRVVLITILSTGLSTTFFKRRRMVHWRQVFVPNRML